MAKYEGVAGGARYKASKKTFMEDAAGRFETTNLSEGDVTCILEVRANNVAVVSAAIDQAVARALEAIGLQAESHAKAKCPVDTGRLRNSITHVVDTGTNEVSIGTNVEYARFVEDDTCGGKRKGKHFLRDAATNHGSEYRSILETMLKNG